MWRRCKQISVLSGGAADLFLRNNMSFGEDLHPSNLVNKWCDIHLACDVSVTGTLYSQNNGFRSCTIFERFLSNGFCSKLN